MHPKFHDVRRKVQKAFRELRKKGFFARSNFMCCQTCALAEIPNDKSERYVFYHQQDHDLMLETGRAYIAYSSDVSDEIVRELKDQGLLIDWNGDSNKRIVAFL